MTGQAGQLQPGGQVRTLRHRGVRALARIPSAAWLLFALAALAVGFNRGGIWDPFELRMAELARRLAPQLFHLRLVDWAESAARIVTATEIGQGELTVTSSALGFALFGVSDWAGRIASLFWGATALVALWVLLGRLSGRVAQVTSVLILASTPLFAWQSRTMLGDAATISSQTLATVGLLLLCRRGPEVAWSSRARAALLALVGSGLGYLCRGVLTGVSIPFLAVGLASLSSNSDQEGRRFQFRAGCGLLAFGLIGAILGTREALLGKNGFTALLGATLGNSSDAIPFDTSVGTLLHQAFPLSAFLPWMVAGLVLRRRGNRSAGDEHWVALTFAWVSVLALVNGMLMARRGVSFAFPSISALAALMGISVQDLARRPLAASAASISVLTLAVLLFADFANTPETQLLLTGVQGGQLPESFVSQGRLWLRVSLAALLAGGAATILFNTAPRPRGVSWRARLFEPFERVRTAFGGQLLSGLILVETSLGTLALLQRAHDEGWITVPWFDTTRALVGSFLSWAWVLPPLLLFVAPATFVSVRLLFERLSPPYTHSERPGAVRWMPALMATVALVAAGLSITLGHAPLLAEQLSPKRVALQYRAHAHEGEPLALLGLRPESVRYYLGVRPLSFQDIGAAAKWLHEAEPSRRWLMLRTEHLAEANAAFRAEGRENLVIEDEPASSVLLATNRRVDSAVNHNPIARDVLSVPPAIEHPLDIEFGDVFDLVGWDLRSESGKKVSRMRTGSAYELKLVFRVLGTTPVDWQIFVHLDGNAKRHNGDHEPVLGNYPTSLWQPGDVIVDRHRVVLEGGSLPGTYTLFMGLFRGSRRLEVTRGAHAENRVFLGSIEVE